MASSFVTFLSIFLIVYALANFYVGLRGWQCLRDVFPGQAMLYWLLYIIPVLSYPLGRFAEKYLPFTISHVLTIIGSYWLALLYYLFLLIITVDILRVLDWIFGFIPPSVKQSPSVVGLTVLICAAAIVLYGIWNARTPVVQHYDITLNKSAGTLQELHLVMVSDIHLGKIVGTRELEQLVNTINGLNPDIVMLAGDIIDEDVDLFAEKEMSTIFRRLKPNLGIYAVLGNHEYIGGQPDLAIKHLQQGGITVLRDSYVRIDDSFYIVGRDDRFQTRFGARKSLPSVMTGIDKSLPIILLDHQPFNLEEADGQGVDLQLSGHTHQGQMFPNNLVTQRMYEIDWGYLQKKCVQVIVSCGFGTWGPPIRVGNTPEIVDIKVKFEPKKTF